MYLVMRYVDGIDLSTLISRDGPLDPSRAARIVDRSRGRSTRRMPPGSSTATSSREMS